MNQINPDLNETAEKVCGFLGCQRFAGDAELVIAVLNDFDVAQEMHLHVCAIHEFIVNAVSAAKCITTTTGGGGDPLRGSYMFTKIMLWNHSAEDLKLMGVDPS